MKLAPSAILALVLAPAIGGCSLVPDYNRPDVALAATWNTSPPASRGAGMVQSGWWRRFGSGELNQFLARSLSDALTLQIAVARLRQAEGTAQVVAAPQFPTLDLTATLDRASGVKSSQTQQVLAQASYEIDFWGKNRAAAGSGDALVSASAFDADTVAMTLSASVANTYFTILSLRERIRLAQQIAADARQVLDLVQIRRQAGTATDLQVQQQQSSLATFEAVVPALRQQKDVAIHALAVLTGQAPEGFTVRASTLNGLARPAVLPDLPPALLARRPDIQAAEARLMSANFDVGVARAAFFPSLSLNAALGAGSATLVHFLPPTALTDVGANLLQPLFHAGQLEGQLKFSREKQTELVATYRQTVLTAFQDVEDALSTLSHVSAQEKIEAKAVTAAQGAADLAQLQYRLGSADYLSVLATEQALYQARDALLQLRLLHLQAIVGLCRALGGGFDHADNSATASVADREAADRTDGDAL